MKKLKNLMRTGGKLLRVQKPWGEKGGNLTGVCEGLGTYFGVKPVFFRIGFVLSTIFMPFISLLGYLFMAGILPDQKGFSFIQDTDWEKLQRSIFQKQRIGKEKKEKEILFVICENCDTAVQENSKFCHNCGARI